MLPGSNLLLGGGKEGVLYLLDPAISGQLVGERRADRAEDPGQGGHVMGGPVFWDSSAAGPLVYNWAEDDVLRSYQLSWRAAGDAGIRAGWSGVAWTSRGIAHRVGERRGPGDRDCLGIDAD